MEIVIFKERFDAKTEVTLTEKEPIIYIAPIALDKMALYVQGCDKEIGWLGKVEKQDNFYIIHDVYLFKQEVHATTCEISPEGLSEFIMETLNSNPDTGMDIVNNLRLWGHSHVNMGVSPSGQDNTQVNSFRDTNPWFVRVIANKSGEMEFCIYDFINYIQYKNVKWKEYRVGEVTLEEQIKAEIKEKVSVKSYATTYSSYSPAKTKWNEVTRTWEEPAKTKLEVVAAKNVSTIVKTVDDQDYYSVWEDEYGDKYYGGYNGYGVIEIDELFTKKQLKSLAKCETIIETAYKIAEMGIDIESELIEPLDVMTFAYNKYGKRGVI